MKKTVDRKMDNDGPKDIPIASAAMEEEVETWMFLERQSSSDDSTDTGLVLQIAETDTPSDLESDSSSIVVVDDSSITQPDEPEDECEVQSEVAATSAETVEETGGVDSVGTEEAGNVEVQEDHEEAVIEESVEEFKLADESPLDSGEEDSGEEDSGALENSVPRESSEEQLQFKPPPDLLEVANRIDELDQLDYSTLTHQDLPADLSLSTLRRTRHYIHHRNSRLNLLLNFIVAFTVAGVLGFGLGHFIGLSDNFPPRPGCSHSTDEIRNSKKPGAYEHLTETDLRTELQRMAEENRQLVKALEAKNPYCVSDKQENLVQENEDLKSTIVRIRYGRPVRSYEDRDTINRLQTENQDLRELVGKLRYSCKGSEIPFNFSSWNVTDLWNRYIIEATNNLNASQGIKDQLHRLKEGTVDMVRAMEHRWLELQNLSKQLNSPELASVVTQTFSESLDTIVGLGSKFVSEKQETASKAVNDLTKKIGDVLRDVKKSWSNIKQKFDAGKKTARETIVNEDWFTEMAKGREAARSKEKRSDWVFSRAQARGKERQKKTESTKNREQKSKRKLRSSKY